MIYFQIPSSFVLILIAICFLILFIGACIEARMMGRNPFKNFANWLLYFLFK